MKIRRSYIRILILFFVSLCAICFYEYYSIHRTTANPRELRSLEQLLSQTFHKFPTSDHWKLCSWRQSGGGWKFAIEPGGDASLSSKQRISQSSKSAENVEGFRQVLNLNNPHVLVWYTDSEIEAGERDEAPHFEMPPKQIVESIKAVCEGQNVTLWIPDELRKSRRD